MISQARFPMLSFVLLKIFGNDSQRKPESWVGWGMRHKNVISEASESPLECGCGVACGACRAVAGNICS